MNTTLISLVAMEAKLAAKGETTLDGIVTKCFEGVKNHWAATRDEDKFNGAVCAIYELVSEDDKERVKEELKMIRSLSALLSGVPVDFDQLPHIENPIGLMKRWTEIKEGNSVPDGNEERLADQVSLK